VAGARPRLRSRCCSDAHQHIAQRDEWRIPDLTMSRRSLSEAYGLLILTIESRMPFHVPIFNAQDPELSLRNTPSLWKAHN
jgi:hypothetical protein